MPISDKEIDILKFISKTHRKIHENRIKRELHVVITTLSFYAACVAIKLKNDFPYGKIFAISAFLAFIIIAIYVCKYLKKSGESNDINQGIAEISEDILYKNIHKPDDTKINELLAIFGDSDISKKVVARRLSKCHPSADRWKWQTIIVICGAIIAYIIIAHSLINLLITCLIACFTKPS